MNTTELAQVAEMIAEMRATCAAIDYRKYHRMALMIEAFADLIERDYDMENRADPSEAAVNVSEKHSEHRQFVGGCDRCEDQMSEAREMAQEFDRE